MRDDDRRQLDRVLALVVSVLGTDALGPYLRPWRFPPAFDFQYGDWLRAEFESGVVEPDARSIYLGDADDRWGDIASAIHEDADEIVAAIGGKVGGGERR